MRGERSPGGLALYAAAFAIELVPACLRALLAALVLAILPGVSAEGAGTALAWAVALAPNLWSLAAFCGAPGGAGLHRLGRGARKPSERERTAIDEALGQLAEPVRAPWRIYVIDAPTLEAFVIGPTLYLSRAMLRDPALPAVLAHELGHLTSVDGRLVLAANRFVIWEGSRGATLLLGGLAFVALRPLWLAWNRHREFSADRYAARLGQAHELVEFLEREQLFDVAVPFMRGRTHPYSEQRIERLLAADELVADERLVSEVEECAG